LSNEGSFLVSSPGTYTVSVSTRNPSGGFYPEAACNATTTVSCSAIPVDLNPGFTIEKVATNDDGPYDIGDLVNFRVTIRNTGETTLNNIAYRDVFDHRYLEFVSVRGTSPANPAGIDMTDSFTKSVSGNITTFTNPDITVQLGDLGVGQSIVFNYVFRARLANNRACNDVFASANGLPEEQARDCIGVIIRTDM